MQVKMRYDLGDFSIQNFTLLKLNKSDEPQGILSNSSFQTEKSRKEL
jgi:hypothetical protein